MTYNNPSQSQEETNMDKTNIVDFIVGWLLSNMTEFDWPTYEEIRTSIYEEFDGTLTTFTLNQLTDYLDDQLHSQSSPIESDIITWVNENINC